MEILTIIIKCLLILIVVLSFVHLMTKQITADLVKQKEINKTLLRLFQNERDKADTLYRILKHIRQELSLLNLKDCPDEEKINIPNEIIAWINELEEINNGKYDDTYAIHK